METAAAAFTHVLCPIDFSETSQRALRHAAALAARTGARLSVLHVTPDPGDYVPVAGELGAGVAALAMPPRSQVVGRLSAEIDRVLGATTAAEALVAAGRPHQVVLEQAAAIGADLLVLGTHGRTGFERLFLGSTTEKVLQTATCPVLTVPPGAAGTEPIRLARILCPTDFSASARRARDIALDIARRSEGEVTLLHALEYVDPEGLPPYADVAVQAHRTELLEHVRQRLHAEAAVPGAGCEVHEAVAVNKAWREILDMARSLPADLIVMGAQGHSGIELLLYGSTTQHVVRRATCPVLTVRG